MLTHVIWDLGNTLINHPPDGQDLRPLYEYSEVRLREGAVATLQALQDKGFVQAVLSNTARSDRNDATRLLDKLGVRHFFTFIHATQSELTHDKPEKPDPAAFAIVLSALGIKPANAVMIGNSWDNDILGANRVGMHAVWLTNPVVATRQSNVSILNPPWVIPVFDLDSVPQALQLLQSVS